MSATYNTKIVRERDGEVLRVKSGGSVIFESGSSLLIGSDDLIAELELLDGLSTQLEALASVSAGTVAASKAVIVDSNKDIADFRNVGATGTVTVKSGGALTIASGATFNIGATAVTSSAAELNILDGVTATAAELNTAAGVTAGTVAASKAVVVDANKDVSEFRNVGMAGTLTFGAGSAINADSGTATCTTNAATLNKMAGVITTEALTTAAAATQAITITNSLVTSSDLVFVEIAGGTNTKACIAQKTVSGSGSFVVTLRNIEASDALDGTVIFNFLVVKA